jgi:hypothetical protein
MVQLDDLRPRELVLVLTGQAFHWGQVFSSLDGAHIWESIFLYPLSNLNVNLTPKHTKDNVGSQYCRLSMA